MNTKVEISKRLVLINSASSVVTRVVNISVMVWLHQYLLRRISPEEYSLYPVLMGVIMFVPLFTLFLNAGLARFITEAYACGDEQRITRIASTMFLPLLAASLIVVTAGGFLTWYVDHVLTIAPDRLWDARIMLGLLLFSAAVILPLGPFCVGLYVRQRFVLSNLIELGATFLKTGLLFALLFGVSTRVLWVVVATVSAGIIQTIVTLRISRRMLPALRFRLDQVDWTMGKKVMGFGGWSVISNIGGLLQRTLDPIFLNKLGTAMDVTCYHLGTMPLRHIWGFTATAVSPLQPQLTAMHATDRREQLRNTYLRGCRYGLWFVLFVTLPVIIYRKELITLYVGQKYLGAADILALSLAAGSYSFCNWFLPQIAHAKGQMKPLALRVAFLQLVRLLLVIYFLGWRHMGAMGMALSTFCVTLIGGSLLSLPLGWHLAGVSGKTWFKEVILRGGFPGLSATIVWIGLQIMASPSSWVSLGACTFLGCALYAIVLLVFCLSDYERAQLSVLRAKVKTLGRSSEQRQVQGSSPRC